MFYAVLEDACLELLSCTEIFFTYILLGAENNGLGAVFAINLVNGLIETLHLLVALCIVIDEVRLHAIVGTDAHDDDTRTSMSVTMPGNEREVQMLFFFDMSSMGMQSSPLSSFQVRMAPTLFSVARTQVSGWLAKSRAVLMPMACRRAA